MGASEDENAGPAPLLLNGNAVLDYNASEFVDTGIVDFSYLHGEIAGERGFLLAGTNGHFYFEDGSRARFWGINVAKDSVFQSKDRIDRAVAAISRAGFNLVRIHHIDDVGGLLPTDSTGTLERIDTNQLDCVDYWIYRCKEAGIYVYLDLLDFRTFTEAEGVVNASELGRAAKPYAVFDNTLIELQQRYARALLIDHVNPYTGLAYADDPAIALLELCDENGLYFARNRWGDLVEPYASQLRQRWNEWLRQRYGNDAMLAEAWTDTAGERGILPGEKLSEGSVWLFPEAHMPSRFPAAKDGESTRLQRGRAADRRLFIHDIHAEYLRRMRTYLTRRGVKVPITAVLDFNHVADMATVAGELDFMGANFYYDHPLWKAGNEWHLPAFHVDLNPIADGSTETFVPRMLVSRIWNKPSVIREWNVCWPNRNRATGMVEGAVYGALQDIDAMILFTYDLLENKQRVEFFDVRSDPTRWGLMGVCAKLFIQRDVSPADHTTAMAFSEVDKFYPTWQKMPTDAYKLGWVSQFSTLFFNDRVPKDGPDLLLASGRSASGIYNRDNTIICSNWPTEDLLDHKRDSSIEQKMGYSVATIPGDYGFYNFSGTMYDAKARERIQTDPAFMVADAEAQGLRPIGVDGSGQACVGFRDMERNIYAFRRLTAHQKLRVALDALGNTYGANVSHNFVDDEQYVSDTGEIIRDVRLGVLAVNAPEVLAVAGRLDRAGELSKARLRVKTASETGVVVWTSLDRRSPEKSSHWMLKMATVAENTGQSMKVHYSNAEKTVYALTELGHKPITTKAMYSATPTVVSINNTPIISVYLREGTWELLYEDGSYYFSCDTSGVKVELPSLAGTVAVNLVADELNGPKAVQQPVSYGQAFDLLRICRND